MELDNQSFIGTAEEPGSSPWFALHDTRHGFGPSYESSPFDIGCSTTHMAIASANRWPSPEAIPQLNQPLPYYLEQLNRAHFYLAAIDANATNLSPWLSHGIKVTYNRLFLELGKNLTDHDICRITRAADKILQYYYRFREANKEQFTKATPEVVRCMNLSHEYTRLKIMERAIGIAESTKHEGLRLIAQEVEVIATAVHNGNLEVAFIVLGEMSELDSIDPEEVSKLLISQIKALYGTQSAVNDTPFAQSNGAESNNPN